VIVVVAAVIEDNQHFFLTRRQPGAHLAGMWEFPGGKIDANESHASALKRELREELGVDLEVNDLMYETTHAYPDRTVALYFYRCSFIGSPQPLLGQEMRWVPRGELRSLGLPPADVELIELLTAETG
jgi:mutator protein MutT